MFPGLFGLTLVLFYVLPQCTQSSISWMHAKHMNNHGVGIGGGSKGNCWLAFKHKLTSVSEKSTPLSFKWPSTYTCPDLKKEITWKNTSCNVYDTRRRLCSGGKHLTPNNHKSCHSGQKTTLVFPGVCAFKIRKSSSFGTLQLKRHCFIVLRAPFWYQMLPAHSLHPTKAKLRNWYSGLLFIILK